MFSIINGTLKVAVRVSEPKIGDVVVGYIYPELPYRFRVVAVDVAARTAHVYRVV
jgi:hypothetical protein